MEKCAIFAERCRRRWVLLGLLLVFPGVLNSLALDAALPLGFSETVLLEALDQPVGMSQTPDGRLLIATRNGEIVSCKEGHLSKSLFAKLPLFTDHGEELLSLAMDPQFEVNRFLYVSVIEAVSDYRVVVYRLQADSIDSSHIDPSRSTRLFDLSVSSGERRSSGPMRSASR